ncbi:hypothetical protein [Streptomyces sp. NPDC048611]|uniref:hypothetical protein n=1 Tax=Streptomyces sp. NPDC048611 TaxID=3155635 RepID=UPI00343A78E4
MSAATYNGTVRFTDRTGAAFGSAEISVSGVSAGRTRPAPVSGTFLKSPDGQGPKSGRCKPGQVWQTNSGGAQPTCIKREFTCVSGTAPWR